MEEVLVYINFVCKNIDDTYEYDFLFSETPDFVWGNDWGVYNPSSCDYTYPDESTINNIYRVKTNLPLKLIQDTNCQSIEYATFGIMALGWIDIDKLEVYPENGRMVFKFKQTHDEVENLLSKYDFSIIKK